MTKILSQIWAFYVVEPKQLLLTIWHHANNVKISIIFIYTSSMKLNIKMLECQTEKQWDFAKKYRQKYFFDNVPIDDPYTWTFNHKEHLHFILYQDQDMIGYAHIQLWADHRAAIRIIVIDETKRNNSCGSQFLALMEHQLKAKGYKSIHAESRKESLSFYTKMGYTSMPFNDPDGYEVSEEDIPVGKTL